MLYSRTLEHFTVVCLVAWPLNENKAEGDLLLMKTSLPFLRTFLLISISIRKAERFISTRSTSASLTFKDQATKDSTIKWSFKKTGHRTQ